MNEVLTYFKNNEFNPFKKEITVYGWQREYPYTFLTSAVCYLFEDLNIIENLAPLTNDNRPGTINPKFYITVHDTGDQDPNHTAKFWNKTVYDMHWSEGYYGASFQYVVGVDGIYRQIPDQEVAYHAGDGTKCLFTLYDSLVDGTNLNPVVTISTDGYFVLDGKKTIILAPKKEIEQNGVVTEKIATTDDINDYGVLVKLIGKRYYIGQTYYNKTYKKIVNRCGNTNSIGIESSINEGTNINYTWQLTSKLVAKLMDEYNIPLNMVKTHHYFSGKNCPQTMRMNNLWNYFLFLVKSEYDILQFKKKGYKIEFIPLSSNLNEKGQITSFKDEKIKYKIVTTYENKKEELEFETIVKTID